MLLAKVEWWVAHSISKAIATGMLHDDVQSRGFSIVFGSRNAPATNDDATSPLWVTFLLCETGEHRIDKERDSEAVTYKNPLTVMSANYGRYETRGCTPNQHKFT